MSEIQSGSSSSEAIGRLWVRVLSEDSAFVYFVMEAQQGLMSYRTLDHAQGVRYRDLEVLVPWSQIEEGLRVLRGLPEVLILNFIHRP